MTKSAEKSANSRGGGFAGDERIVVLHGKQVFLLQDRVRELRAAAAQKTGREVDVLSFDGETAQLADVFDELRSMGLMMQHKLVVVDNADTFVKNFREQLERYAQQPVEGATLVLRGETWNKGNLDKHILKVGAIIKCEELSTAETIKWVSERCAAVHRAAIARPAAQRLVERIGRDLGRLDGELGKLASGAGEGHTIDVDEVESLVGRASDEQNAWRAMQEAMLTPAPGSGPAHGRALEKLYELNEIGNANEIMLMRAASDLMLKLCHAARMLQQKRGDFEICQQLRIWPPDRQRPFMDAARRLGPRKSARLLEIAVELDARSKSGFGDAKVNLQRFCVLFAGQLR